MYVLAIHFFPENENLIKNCHVKLVWKMFEWERVIYTIKVPDQFWHVNGMTRWGR
jgi:hypothetical protein